MFSVLFDKCLRIAISGILWGGIAMESSYALKLSSTEFGENEMIPREYTCSGDDISPPLTWSEAPEGTAGFALVMDDPDAPMGTWDHWVLYSIPPHVSALPEGLPVDAVLPDGSMQGINDFRKTGYGGPCPPPGSPHRYVFTLYALDAIPEMSPGMDKDSVLDAIKGHILDKATLTGLYSR